MKNYTITVNGTAYDVTVEETGSVGSAPVAKPKTVNVPVASAPAKAAVAPKTSGAGSVEVKSGAAGKVVKIVSEVGQTVKKGDSLIIIESMKMEIPVVAPEDGAVASIDVAVGDSIDSDVVLATLN